LKSVLFCINSIFYFYSLSKEIRNAKSFRNIWYPFTFAYDPSL
jgi:hypothetical protein